MNFAEAIANINWLSILAASLSAFVIGGIWYGPLFGKAWMAASGKSEDELQQRNMVQVFTVSLLLILIAAINLEMFIGSEGTLAYGIFAGLLAGTGWVATFMGVIYLFEQRSLKLWLINAGYSVIALTLMGSILGAW